MKASKCLAKSGNVGNQSHGKARILIIAKHVIDTVRYGQVSVKVRVHPSAAANRWLDAEDGYVFGHPSGQAGGTPC